MFKHHKEILHKYHVLEGASHRAKKDPKRIIFPEAMDLRVLKAAYLLVEEGICEPILLGHIDSIVELMKDHHIPRDGMTIISPLTDRDEYANVIYEKRKKKGMSLDRAKELVTEPIYYATAMLENGDADAIVSGAAHPSAHTFRPALKVIGPEKKGGVVSSYFMMLLDKKVFFFADCGLNINPDEKQLAEIAISTADSAKRYGFTPKIAMLSFSTHGSAGHPLAEKVQKATALVKKKCDYAVDGELQIDAAIVPKVADLKAPKSPLKGEANILVFPDLNAANIAYKLVERLAGAMALGPLSQGLNKLVNDLSEGCSVEDIVEVATLSVVQVQDKEKEERAKKSAKKSSKKPVKEATKKSSKKSAKKPVKKTVKKSIKKSAKKPSKKPAKTVTSKTTKTITKKTTKKK